MLPNIVNAESERPASSLRSLGMRPLLMTGIIRRLLIDHFADPAGIEAPSLQDCVWTDGSDTRIVIESAGAWKPREVETRPALIIKRGTWQSARIGLADQSMTPDNLEGDAYRTKMMHGTHTVTAISQTEAAADILAFEVYSELSAFAEVIRRDLRLTRLTIGGVGESTQRKESRDDYLVQIPIIYAAEENYTVKSAAPVLKTYDYRAGS